MPQRIGTVFHESFSLSRVSVSQVMAVVSTVAEGSDKPSGLEEALRNETHLGTRYVKAMPRYGKGAGLLTLESEGLTVLGKTVHRLDPLLEHFGTQWLMHYHLSAPHGPGPAFWSEIVATRFRTGNEFSAEDLATQIAEFSARETGKELAWRSARSTATVFLGTYTKPDGLGKLGILEQVESGAFRVQSVEPPTWAAAYALLDYWLAQYTGRASINLGDLTAEGGFAELLLMGEAGLADVLGAMQSQGYVEVYRSVPPYQVLLLQREPEPLLRRLYDLQ